jgi:sporulation protein YlmC with PRC-barrel domain
MRSIALGIAVLVPLVFGGNAALAAGQKKAEKVAGEHAAPFRQVEDMDKLRDWRGSKLIGSQVKDKAGQDIGKIEDLLVERDGRITHAVLSFGGLLGVGDRLYVVPWSTMRVERRDKDNVTVMLDNVKKEELEKAPRYTERAARYPQEPAASTREARSDSMITVEVKTKLAREKLGTLTKVDVDTKDGVVHLTGTVDSDQMKARASALARQVKGVRDVKNDLRVGG